MLTSLTLKNFRGFDQLDMPKLARVNLIGGGNNAGKTALLEAIFLLLEREQAQIQKLPQLFRAPSGINNDRYFWRWLAHNGDDKAEASITADINRLGSKTVWWCLQQFVQQKGGQHLGNYGNRALVVPALDNSLKAMWPTPEIFSPGPTPPIEDAKVYIEAAKKTTSGGDGEERIESLLREIEPRLKRVRAYPDEQSSQPIIHVSLGMGEALPANQLGQGFNRLLRIYSSLLRADAKVFLIDEVETGLHHSVLPTIWKGLAAVARQEDVQIFATTHSREAILAAHRVFSGEPRYDFAYHRLERANGHVQAVTYDKERLEGADERNFELR